MSVQGLHETKTGHSLPPVSCAVPLTSTSCQWKSRQLLYTAGRGQQVHMHLKVSQEKRSWKMAMQLYAFTCTYMHNPMDPAAINLAAADKVNVKENSLKKSITSDRFNKSAGCQASVWLQCHPLLLLLTHKSMSGYWNEGFLRVNSSLIMRALHYPCKMLSYSLCVFPLLLLPQNPLTA